MQLKYRRQSQERVTLRIGFAKYLQGIMPSSGMLRRVALVRTDVSEERICIFSQCASVASYG
jgi:hypothetical protein